MTATQLTITLTDSSTVVVPISAALQTPDGFGFNAADAAIQNIMRGKGFWDATNSIFRPVSQIKTITYQ
jgi:hypothetical protein